MVVYVKKSNKLDALSCDSELADKRQPFFADGIGTVSPVALTAYNFKKDWQTEDIIPCSKNDRVLLMLPDMITPIFDPGSAQAAGMQTFAEGAPGCQHTAIHSHKTTHKCGRLEGLLCLIASRDFFPLRESGLQNAA